ncbi:enoyl-CoA hydratase-related protein [Zhongshania aquimaris]|uniref:Enoyl-CoA hydratase/isomerase family protein n=1 Tax=Zhongshania aquimaris TaxID=2857107 RepID=A0ABS6VSN9_9GAMM|nr:enoyl-CoA hydratase-related protein [Zhongshania aquimaris]MBW2941330.1 enoyl-CoA hydratase/isomerase family protein [Zhongshania aquimaris]
MSDSTLIQEQSETGVLRIILNRPEVHNAFDDIQIQSLIEALSYAQSDPTVKVVILEGSGKSFSAGGDINYMRRMGSNTYEDNIEDASRLALLMKTLNFLPKPTIARVHGAAMGGGVGLVCCCDFAIASPAAKLALSEIKLGMVPATIAPYVVQTIGPKAARRLFMTGEMLSADSALKLGFLSELVEEDQLDVRIAELAAVLLANAPNGLSKVKKIVSDVSHGEIDDDMIAGTVKFIADIRDSDEGREGLSAFLEKRPPAWQAQVTKN